MITKTRVWTNLKGKKVDVNVLIITFMKSFSSITGVNGKKMPRKGTAKIKLECGHGHVTEVLIKQICI